MILLVTALRAEALPLGLALTEREMLDRRLVMGRLAGRPAALLRCGVGRERARAQTEAAVKRLEPDWVLSLGTAGGLDDGLDIGETIGASEVILAATGERFETAPLPGVRAGAVLTVDALIHTPQRRAEAGRQAMLCEMEAAGVAQAARGRRFSALKVVSDHAGATADPALLVGSPASIARFQRRAAELCWERLVPALRRALG